MNNILYAIIVDSCMQLSTYAIKYLQDEKTCEKYCEIDRRICGTEFAKNVFDRPIEFWNLNVNVASQDSFYGWHIGKKDFEKFEKMSTLTKSVDEFERLAKI